MKLTRIVAVLGLLLILLAVNWSIYKQEQVLTQGKTVLLKLAPVDPRSLMQGDYMALRFEIANQIRSALLHQNADSQTPYKLEPQEGYVVVKRNQQNEAEFVRIDHGEALAENELCLFFRVRHGMVKFATNAFFSRKAKHQNTKTPSLVSSG
ncbi:GDYXXLXY domain-containing protein [Methylophaga thalassica]|uniref:GDYXXLXY domain-containing protein n=1 Tax=Methylophaga thalassica TaxID=40223 RepID=UPI00361672DB